MKAFQKLWSVLTGPAPVAPAPELLSRPVIPAPKPERPAASSLARAVDLVRERPNMTARDLAMELSLTPSYARTLLKRALAKLASEEPLVPTPEPVAEIAEETVAAPVQLALVAGPRMPELADLQSRLEQAEKSLAHLCAAPAPVRVALSVNRRAEVVRMAGGGMGTSDIAAVLGIPGGEVDFIVKMHRLLQTGQ